jgi:hypothetical protein
VELPHGCCSMGFHRLQSDVEDLRDFLVRATFGNESHNARLPVAKLLSFPCRTRKLRGVWRFHVGHRQTEATWGLALLSFERSALTRVPRLPLIGALARRPVIIHTEHRSGFR